MTMGSFSETAMTAIDMMREAGKKIGLFRLRLWRPFPYRELRDTVKNAKNLIILDRAISYGGPGGPVASEIKSALYPLARRPRVIGFVGGLGGRDISPADFETIIHRGLKISNSGSNREFEIFGVRE
jgi:pyruvate ferredoxin oxidoreductase alpha subunit